MSRAWPYPVMKQCTKMSGSIVGQEGVCKCMGVVEFHDCNFMYGWIQGCAVMACHCDL